MPTAVIGAGIGAVGSVAGGISSEKGAAKAAQIQQQTAQQQIAAAQQLYNTNKSLIMPTYQAGQDAQSRIATMLGLPGGDGTDAQATLAATPGYQFTVDQALKGVNSSAYASGLGNSGAALKALQDRAAGLASQNYNNYVGQLSDVANRGVSATNALVGAGNTSTALTNSALQNSGNAASADAAYSGTNLANILKGLSTAGSAAFGSSYGNSYPGYAADNAAVQNWSNNFNPTVPISTTLNWNS